MAAWCGSPPTASPPERRRNPAGYRGSDTDVTDRKRAEEELRENENSLRESQIIAGLGNYVLNLPTGCGKGRRAE